MTRSITFRRGAAALVAATLVLAGCGSDDDAEEPAGSEEVSEAVLTATDAWARTSPAAVENGAAYMQLTSTEDVAVIGASVSEDVAGTAEVHETVMADASGDTGGMNGEMNGMDDESGDMGGMGGMTMQEVEEIAVPAGETVALEPGGYHVMLLGLVAPLEIGDTFDVTLALDNGDELVVPVEVREDAP